jgi:hypothetical protein
MARLTRLEIPNGWYHVINRGISGEQLSGTDGATKTLESGWGSLRSVLGSRSTAMYSCPTIITCSWN